MPDLAGHRRAVSWFTLVGAAAAVVHYVIAVTLEGMFAVPPGWANLIGFSFAFPVSYLGHSRLSFNGQGATHRRALPRFFTIAVTGFLGNQTLLLGLLAWSGWPFWLALALVLALVAFLTYMLSRYWAFKSA